MGENRAADVAVPIGQVADPREKSPKAVPLEEALELCGHGMFNYLIVTAGGLQVFASLATILIMSYVVPAIGCDFSLTSSDKGTLGTMSFLGMVCSSHLNGFLSDRYGRKYTAVRCSAICCILSCAASFALNYTILIVLWFIMGVGLAGIITPVYVYVSEFSSQKRRRMAMLITVAISCLATTYDPCVAWLIIPLEIRWTLWPGMVFSPWRLLLLSNAVPLLVATLVLWILPESPKYLLTRGQDQDTLNALAEAFAMNTGQDKSNFPVKEVYLDSGDMLAEDNSDSIFGFLISMWNQTRLLFTPPLLLYTLICCIVHVGVIGSYNMVMLWFPEIVNQMSLYWASHPEYKVTLCQVLASANISTSDGWEQPTEVTLWNNRTDEIHLQVGGSMFGYATEVKASDECVVEVNTKVFMSNIAVGIVQFIVFLLTNPIVSVFGMRIVLGTFLAIPGLCCILVSNLADSMYMTISLIGCLAVLAGASLPILLSIVVDLFPTYIRSMATSIAMVCGRIGAAVGGQVFGYYQKTHCISAFNLIGVILLCIAGVCFVMPMKRKM